jgi:hypothetical protein
MFFKEIEDMIDNYALNKNIWWFSSGMQSMKLDVNVKKLKLLWYTIHKKYGIKVWTIFSHRRWSIFQQLEGVPMHDYKYFKLCTMQRFNERLFRHPNMFYAFEASHYWWQMPMMLWALVKECFIHEDPLLQVRESLVKMRETHNLKEWY